MNLYSRALKYIDIESVKRKNADKLIEDNLFYQKIREAREVLKNWNCPSYSNWRSNDLKEGMTTDNVFFTTFPSTGEINLDNIDGSNSQNYTDAGGNDAFEGTSIRSSGTGEGSDGGFNLGQSYLGFDGDASSRWAILNPIDSSKFDTLVLRAIRGDDNNGGEDPDEVGEELRLYYLAPNSDTFRSISVNQDGVVNTAISDVIIGLSDGTSQSLRDWSITLPSYARGEGFTYMLYQLSNSGVGFDHYGITNIKYQRKSPISLLVSLDSPEATSFMSDGSGNMTAEQKKKRLEDMLAASDEYLETMFPTNQEAMRRAEENLKRNIDISLDPDTFNLPAYGSPTWDQMFNAKIDAESDLSEIERALEQQGVTLDTLDQVAVKNKGEFEMGREATLVLLNNPDTQEKALTALGIDLEILNNLTPDSFDKIRKITNLRPGGTPVTGWNGRFYELNDPNLEASRIIPLETYLQVKGTDNYAGVERPDRAEPGRRYLMEKKYSFLPDSDATPTYTGPQNKQLDDASQAAHNQIYSVGASVGNLGYTWDLYHFENGLDHTSIGGPTMAPGTNYAREQVVESMTAVLNHMYRNADLFAYIYAGGGVYGSMAPEDLTQQYDPLYFLLQDERGQRALDIALNSTARQLDYGRDDFGGSDPERRYQDHLKENDRTIERFQEAYNKIKTLSTNFASYDNDEWYGGDDQNVIAVKKVHPYSGLTEPELTPEEPTPEQPQQPTEDRDAYNYYPDFNEIEDIPSRITGEDVKMTIDDLGAAGYAAYKAGGGDAKVKEGFTVAEVIKQGQININAFHPGAPVQKPISNPEKQTPSLFNGLVELVSQALPTIRNKVDIDLQTADGQTLTLNPTEVKLGIQVPYNIAKSILTNEPIKISGIAPSTQRTFVKALDQAFTNNVSYNIPINNKPVPYSDDHIRELDDGTVVTNTTGVNNTGPVPALSNKPGEDLIGSRGQAQLQIVVPDDFSEPYLKYVDHAYLNTNFEPGEVENPVVEGIARGVVAFRNLIKGGGRNTGAFSNYPDFIKGDSRLEFKIPYRQLPKSVQDRINNYRYPGDEQRLKDLGVDTADAATVAADTKRRRRGKGKMNESENHNERITKQGKLKSPSDFFKRADVKPVYPDTPPPEMVQGRHPDWWDGEKVSNRFNRLDPSSAKATPLTGNPKIDKKILKARKQAK